MENRKLQWTDTHDWPNTKGSFKPPSWVRYEMHCGAECLFFSPCSELFLPLPTDHWKFSHVLPAVLRYACLPGSPVCTPFICVCSSAQL